MKSFRILVGLLIALFFLLFLALPVYTVVAEGVRPAYLLEIFRNPLYLSGFLNAFKIALATTVLVVALAVPMALVYDRFDFPGKAVVNLLLLSPLILPPFVGAMGFAQIFGRLGALNSLLTALGVVEFGHGPDWLGGGGRFWAVCVVEALHLYPILYLNVMSSLANVDPSMEEAARNLGCGRWRRFFRVTLPLIKPGLFAGGSIVLIWSFTELGAPLMLGYNRVTTVQIFNGITELETNPLPYSLVVVMLVVACGLYLASRLAFGKEVEATAVKGMVGTSTTRLRGWVAFAPITLFLAVTFAATLPHLGMTLLSFSKNWYGAILPSAWTLDHYRWALSHDLVVPSIVNSVKYSSLAMVLGVVVGLAVALLTTRWRPPGWRVFDVMSMMPLAVPGIVMAFGYLSVSIHYGWAREWLDPVKNPTALLVIAYAMRRLPYATRSAVAGLQQVPVDLELAARNLGAGSFTCLRRITIPLVAANLVIGALFAFSFSMLEVSDSLILAQKSQFFPITRAIFELSQVLGTGPYLACAFGVWAMCFLGGAVAAATVIMGRRLGALFRF